MASKGLRTGLQIFLAIAIAALTYWLYVSITEPWDEVERQRELTDLTRDRMDMVRQTLIYYERREDQFPSSLDSLVIWLNQDSLASLRGDSLFGAGFSPDSLLVSPRTGERFVYALNDTGQVAIYLLKDPNSEDQIGSAQPDVTQLNAASWE